MTEPTILNVVCQQCTLAYMLPLNERTYFCPACQYVGYEKDLKDKAHAIYNKPSETGYPRVSE
jgi:hypothetical protein